MANLAARYVPRRPQETVLYALVKEHLRDFFEHDPRRHTSQLNVAASGQERKAALQMPLHLAALRHRS